MIPANSIKTMKLIKEGIFVDRFAYLRHKKRCNLITISFLIMTYFAYLRVTFETGFLLKNWGWKDNISCYLDEKDDTLPSILDISPTARAIFFHEPTCLTSPMGVKKICSIESAARMNRNWKIYVLFSSPITKNFLENQPSVNFLQSLRNVKFARVNIEDYAMNTPAEGFIMSGALNDSDCPIEFTSGLVKYLTLHKFGGIFIEMDSVVTRSFSSLESNWVPKMNAEDIASGILSFTKDEVGQNFTSAALRELIKSYKNFDCKNGENVIPKIVEQKCEAYIYSKSKSALTCPGFQIYGPQYFYPVSPADIDHLLQEGEPDGLGTAYSYKMWGRLIDDESASMKKNSRLGNLFRMFCPMSYRLFDSL